jgi:SAM-dependent methyltransferase
MTGDKRPRSGQVNGRLWGGRAQDWANIQEGQVRPAYEFALKRTEVRKGSAFCDLGCGAGLAAQMAAELGAKVSGLDAAASLLEIAKRRVPSGDFRLGELEELPFGEKSFDVVTGFNSFQYATNPQAALAEAKRVAKPDGWVVVMTWGQPEGMEAASLVAALKPLLPPPPPGAPGPFALSDEAALRAFASGAGLKPVGVSDVSCPWTYPDLETALRGLAASGVAIKAMENASEEKLNAAHAAALKPFKRPDGSYRVGATFRCLFARA